MAHQIAKPYQMVKPLTYDQWREAMEVFSECFKRCMLRRHIDEKMEVEHWLRTLASTTPVYLFRPDSLELLQEQIFSKRAIHGFILDLHFFFLASYDNGEEFISQMAQKVLEGVCLDGPLLEYSYLPQEVAQSTGIHLFNENNNSLIQKLKRSFAKLFGAAEPHVSLFLFLRNNTWLLIVFILILQLQPEERQD